MHTSIFLIGFAGVGKTTLGKQLAKLLNMPFVDVDTAIEAQRNCSIKELINTRGEVHFRKVETEVLRGLAAQPSVVACGGGSPCFHNNMLWLLENGIVVYLQASTNFLYTRLLQTNLSERPLLQGKTDEELYAWIAQTLPEREHYYKQAHITVQAVKTSAAAIKDLVEMYNQKY